MKARIITSLAIAAILLAGCKSGGDSEEASTAVPTGNSAASGGSVKGKPGGSQGIPESALGLPPGGASSNFGTKAGGG